MIDKYHLDSDAEKPSLSRSIAHILMTQTPLHAWLNHPRLNPDYTPDENKKYDVGTAAHALLLEGVNKMAVIDAADWRKKEAQEQREIARAKGLIPVLNHQSEQLHGMVQMAHESIADSPDMRGFVLSDGEPEKSLAWQMAGVHLRSKLDWLSPDKKLILDYKTTALSGPQAWMRSIGSSGYDLQCVMYQDAVYHNYNIQPEFVFMVQETEYPYLSYFVSLPEPWLDIGRRKYERAVMMWRECMTRNEWPAYDKRAYVPEVPAWEISKADEDNAVFANWSVEGFLFGRVPGKGTK